MTDQLSKGKDKRESTWRNRDFKWFWGGQSVSLLGNKITLFTVPVLAITRLHAHAHQFSSR
ncbi:MAG TPA: hypothetical protein VN695_10550 [Streptosporangiaceae bacterium]|nr:hypothetical protein [Streptosporangiaceae bacterium]